MNLAHPEEIKALKEAFAYSFRGPLGEKTMQFLEEYCGFWYGGPRSDLNQLQYEAGRRDVVLTIKTICNEKWTPIQIAETFRRIEA